LIAAANYESYHASSANQLADRQTSTRVFTRGLGGEHMNDRSEN